MTQSRMTESEIREVANRFFDAYQDQRIEEVADVISDDFVVWLGPFSKLSYREEWLKATVPSWKMHRRRTYNDRQIDVFDGGFVIRYSLNITDHAGNQTMRWICITALCRDGKIYRMDEYMDTKGIKNWQPPPRLTKEQDAFQAFAGIDGRPTR